FQARYPDPARVCIMPVLRGGRVFGEALGYPLNPIRMSYYRGGDRLPQPVCLQKPDPELMVGPDGETLPVVLAEGVIETFSTIRATVAMIEDLCREYGLASPPYYEAQAIVIKTPSPDAIPATLPDPPPGTVTRVVAQFWVHLGIWIHGMGTDDGDRGRDVPEFRGRLSPFAEHEPDPPYFTILNPALLERKSLVTQKTSARQIGGV
ncbi:MAG: phosphoribosyltransferase, partial [Anaerolineae bacterium]|nr:phosphoribosyltransferase [Anaerolineae bacterium]